METTCGALKSWQSAGLPTQGEDGSQLSYLENENPDWGYDGLGLIFTDGSKLINDENGTPVRNMRIAKRGDSIEYAAKVKVEQSYAGNKILSSQIKLYGSEGGEINEECIVVYVDDSVLAKERYDVSSVTPEIGAYSWERVVSLNNISENGDVEVKVVYSVRVSSNVPSEVLGFAVKRIAMSGATLEPSTSAVAKVQLDGNIVINRTDANNNPLAGATYVIDGLKAVRGDKLDDNVYVYSKNGDITEFTTDEQGQIFIKGVPDGNYTVREVSTPKGHSPENAVISQHVSVEKAELFSYADSKYMVMGMDVKELLRKLGDGNLLPEEHRTVLTYDASQNAYVGTSNTAGDNFKVEVKNGEYVWTANNGHTGVFSVDERRGTQWATLTLSDLEGQVSPGSDSVKVIVLEDGTVTDAEGNIAAYNAEDGCYHYDYGGANGVVMMCKDGDAWVSITSAELVPGFTISAAMRLGQGADENVFDTPVGNAVSYIVESVDENQMVLYEGPTMTKLGDKNLFYSMAYSVKGSTSITMSVVMEREQITAPSLATKYLFTDKTADGIPEEIVNPQTADIFLPATLAVVVLTSAAFVAVKRNASR